MPRAQWDKRIIESRDAVTVTTNRWGHERSEQRDRVVLAIKWNMQTWRLVVGGPKVFQEWMEEMFYKSKVGLEGLTRKVEGGRLRITAGAVDMKGWMKLLAWLEDRGWLIRSVTAFGRGGYRRIMS